MVDYKLGDKIDCPNCHKGFRWGSFERCPHCNCELDFKFPVEKPAAKPKKKRVRKR